jgi:hypothetical protein
MPEIGKDLQVEPTHARAVLAQLVRAGDGVALALRIFVGAERKAATWLMRRGWAKRSRAGGVAGQITIAATKAGREEYARRFESADVVPSVAYELGRHDERIARAGAVEPDLLDRCTCTHEYGAHNGRGPCARCKCKRFAAAPVRRTGAPRAPAERSEVERPILRVMDVHLTITIKTSADADKRTDEAALEEAITQLVDEEIAAHDGGGTRCGVSFHDLELTADVRFVEDRKAGGK